MLYQHFNGLKTYELLKLKNKLLCSVLQIPAKPIILTNITYVSFNKYYVTCLCIAALPFQGKVKLFLNMTGEKYKNKLITKHIFHKVSLTGLSSRSGRLSGNTSMLCNDDTNLT